MFRCPTCDTRVGLAVDLIAHMEMKGHTDLPVTCPACKEGYPMMELGPHYQECVVADMNQKAFERKQRKRVEITCATCGKTFKSQDQYKRHVKIHLRAQGLTEEDAATTLYYFCDRCGKKYTEPQSLRNHIKTIHEGIRKPSTCPICLLTFETYAKMQRHRTMKHAQGEKYECKLCGKRSDSISHLRVHMRKHEEPQFKCRFCEKMLKSRDGLTAHERGHTGETPFKCAICGNGYKSLSALGQHKRGVHKILGPRAKSTEKRVRKKNNLPPTMVH